MFRTRFSLLRLMWVVAVAAMGLGACRATWIAYRDPWITAGAALFFVMMVGVVALDGIGRSLLLRILLIGGAGAALGAVTPAFSKEKKKLDLVLGAASIGFTFGSVVGAAALAWNGSFKLGQPR